MERSEKLLRISFLAAKIKQHPNDAKITTFLHVLFTVKTVCHVKAFLSFKSDVQNETLNTIPHVTWLLKSTQPKVQNHNPLHHGIFFPLLCLLLCVATVSACENGWFLNGNHCYRLYNHPDHCASFEEAVSRCREIGAELISIHSHDEQMFINRLAWEFYRTAHFWIGGETIADKLTFHWIDGTAWDYKDPKIFDSDQALTGFLINVVLKRNPRPLRWQKIPKVQEKKFFYMCKKMATQQ